MRLEAITAAAALEALRPDWISLWERDPRSTPFQHPAWLLAWWHAFGNDTPRVMALRAHDRLLALAPLFLWENGAEGSKPVRQLSWIGAGFTDSLDLLVDPEVDRIEVAGALLAQLAELEGFDRVVLEGLRPDSPLFEPAAPGASLRAVCPPLIPEQEEVCPVLELPDTPAAFWAAHPRRHRNFLQSQRRLERDGGLEVIAADGSSWPALLEALFRLHRAAWEARGEPGVLSDPKVQALHREAAEGLLEAGCLRLFGLRHRGAWAGVFYGLGHRRRFYYYLSGFDPALRYYGPGSLLIGLALEQAISEGCGEFDLLRGAEDYTHAGGARDRPLYRLSL